MNARLIRLHERAVSIATTHRKSEADLISILQDIEVDRGYLHLGARSLYDYCERILKLSEATSYNLITVARRAKEVPALKTAVEAGEISVSKARRIAPVITKENQDAWLTLATSKSSREIERAVAEVNPKQPEAERFEFLSSEFTRMTVDVPEALMKKIRRIQDLESQRISSHATIIEVLEAAANEYLERRDPVVKAERAVRKAQAKLDSQPDKGETPTALQRDSQLGTGRVSVKPTRRSIPSAVRHSIYLRDRGQCTYFDSNGRCPSTRWLEVHHVMPLNEGGTDSVDNLTLVCGSHHRLVHDSSLVRSPTLEYVA